MRISRRKLASGYSHAPLACARTAGTGTSSVSAVVSAEGGKLAAASGLSRECGCVDNSASFARPRVDAATAEVADASVSCCVAADAEVELRAARAALSTIRPTRSPSALADRLRRLRATCAWIYYRLLFSSCWRRLSSSVGPEVGAQEQSAVNFVCGGQAMLQRSGFSGGLGVHLHGRLSQ